MVKFVQTQMQKMRFTEWIKESPTLERAFNSNITEQFFADLKHRLFGIKPDHVVIYLWGDTGTYKSSVAQEIASMLYPDFCEDNIVFTSRDITEAIKSLHGNNILIRDENPAEFGVGTRRIAHEVSMYTETLRKAKMSLFFISPTFQEFPSAHYYLRTLDCSEDGRAVRVAVQDSVTQNYLGGVVVNINQDNPVWKAYELKKDDFLASVMGEGGVSGLPVERMARKVMGDKDYVGGMKKKELRLLIYKHFRGLTGGELMLIEAQITLFENG